MPLTILAKKIKATVKSDTDNYKRANGLSEYVATPENKDAKEKCVAIRAYGFSEENPTVETIKDELCFDMMQARIKNNELLSHWVMSWNGGAPKEEDVFEAARELMVDLGYTDFHKQVYAIHADTDNLHVHILGCKVDPWEGKILREGNGWWKNEKGKSLARIAHKFHWQLEAGEPFHVSPNPRMEIVDVPTHQGKKNIKRPIVEKRNGKGGDPTSVHGRAAAFERRTGLKSEERKLKEALLNFLDKNEADFQQWKFGDFHRHLAELGISCERVEHGRGKKSYGLVYSLDGKTKVKGSAISQKLSYDALLKNLGAKNWRPARTEHLAILEQKREEMKLVVEPMESQDIVLFPMETVRKLVTIDIAHVVYVRKKEIFQQNTPVQTTDDKNDFYELIEMLFEGMSESFENLLTMVFEDSDVSDQNSSVEFPTLPKNELHQTLKKLRQLDQSIRRGKPKNAVEAAIIAIGKPFVEAVKWLVQKFDVISDSTPSDFSIESLASKPALTPGVIKNKRYWRSDAQIPKNLEQLGIQLQDKLFSTKNRQVDPQFIDRAVAFELFKSGATQQEVYAWLMSHMAQGERIPGFPKLTGEKKEQEAIKIASILAPIVQIGHQTAWRQKNTNNKRGIKNTLDPVDTEKDRKSLTVLNRRYENSKIDVPNSPGSEIESTATTQPCSLK